MLHLITIEIKIRKNKIGTKGFVLGLAFSPSVRAGLGLITGTEESESVGSAAGRESTWGTLENGMAWISESIETF